jgi:hypothetical protein
MLKEIKKEVSVLVKKVYGGKNYHKIWLKLAELREAKERVHLMGIGKKW